MIQIKPIATVFISLLIITLIWIWIAFKLDISPEPPRKIKDQIKDRK